MSADVAVLLNSATKVLCSTESHSKEKTPNNKTPCRVIIRIIIK